MPYIISFSAVIAHERLEQRLRDLLGTLKEAATEGADLPASPSFRDAAARLLRDIRRLVSREPGARTMPRLAPEATPTMRQLTLMLRDARLHLELFKDAHLDHDQEYGDEWLTLEGIEQFGEEQRHRYPQG